MKLKGVVSVGGVVSFNGGNGPGEVEEISFEENTHKFLVNPGSSINLSCTVYPETVSNRDVTWSIVSGSNLANIGSSSNTGATINSGSNHGSLTIRATSVLDNTKYCDYVIKVLRVPDVIIENPNAYHTGATDHFGSAVACSGGYTVISAEWENDPSGNQSGKVYVFNSVTGELLHTIDNPNPYGTSDDDEFGTAISLSGDYFVVGTEFEGSATGSKSGRAWLYSAITGEMVKELINPNYDAKDSGDYFGCDVGISDSHAVVGARGEDILASNAGVVYVYNATTGQQQGTIANPEMGDAGKYDYFGKTVDVANNRVIIGATSEDEADGTTTTGRVYIYNASSRAQLKTINNPNPVASDQFGYRVAISDNYAIISTASSKVYVYDLSTYDLLHTLVNPNVHGTPDEDRYGAAIAISDNYAIVGAPDETSEPGTGELGLKDTGRVYIFSTTSGELLEVLDNPAIELDIYSEEFGCSVSISSNDRLVVGCRDYSSRDTEGNWRQSEGRSFIYNL